MLVRVLLFFVVFIALFILFSFSKSFLPLGYERFAHGLIGTVAALLTTWLFLRREKKSFADIGLRWERFTFIRFLKGVLTGIVITGLVFICLIYFGGMKLELNPAYDVTGFLLATLALIPLAFMEEVAFRSYPLVNLNQRLGTWPSLFITTVLFAVYHMINGWSVGISFLGPGIWGLLFGLAALYSKGIALPTGIHYAANLVQASLGRSAGFTPIWNLEHKEELSSIRTAESVGILIQISLLILVVVAIEWYRRKHQQKLVIGSL